MKLGQTFYLLRRHREQLVRWPAPHTVRRINEVLQYHDRHVPAYLLEQLNGTMRAIERMFIDGNTLNFYTEVPAIAHGCRETFSRCNLAFDAAQSGRFERLFFSRLDHEVPLSIRWHDRAYHLHCPSGSTPLRLIA